MNIARRLDRLLTASRTWCHQTVIELIHACDGNILAAEICTGRIMMKLQAVWLSGLVLSGFGAVAQEVTGPKLGGTIYLDLDHVAVDGASPYTEEDIRRARFKLTGRLGKFSYIAEVDFAGNVRSVKDLYIAGETSGGTAWRIGQFKEATGLEELSSSAGASFAETSSISKALGAERRFGVSASHAFENGLVLQAAVQAAGVDDEPFNHGYALSARAVFVPVYDEASGHLVHVGASVRYRESGDNSGLRRFRQRAVSAQAPRLIVTPGIAAMDVSYAIEGAWMNGPLWLQGEVAIDAVGCAPGFCVSGDPTFIAAYAEIGYGFGVSQVYDPDFARFKSRKVARALGDGGWGGLEFIARIDRTDLTDNGINGGEQTALQFGANYYPNNSFRFMLGFADINVTGGPAAGADAQTATFRVQYKF